MKTITLTISNDTTLDQLKKQIQKETHRVLRLELDIPEGQHNDDLLNAFSSWLLNERQYYLLKEEEETTTQDSRTTASTVPNIEAILQDDHTDSLSKDIRKNILFKLGCHQQKAPFNKQVMFLSASTVDCLTQAPTTPWWCLFQKNKEKIEKLCSPIALKINPKEGVSIETINAIDNSMPQSGQTIATKPVAIDDITSASPTTTQPTQLIPSLVLPNQTTSSTMMMPQTPGQMTSLDNIQVNLQSVSNGLKKALQWTKQYSPPDITNDLIEYFTQYKTQIDQYVQYFRFNLSGWILHCNTIKVMQQKFRETISTLTSKENSTDRLTLINIYLDIEDALYYVNLEFSSYSINPDQPINSQNTMTTTALLMSTLEALTDGQSSSLAASSATLQATVSSSISTQTQMQTNSFFNSEVTTSPQSTIQPDPIEYSEITLRYDPPPDTDDKPTGYYY